MATPHRRTVVTAPIGALVWVTVLADTVTPELLAEYPPDVARMMAEAGHHAGAVYCGWVEPNPYDPTSFELHLGGQARIFYWDDPIRVELEPLTVAQAIGDSDEDPEAKALLDGVLKITGGELVDAPEVR